MTVKLTCNTPAALGSRAVTWEMAPVKTSDVTKGTVEVLFIFLNQGLLLEKISA